MNNEKIISLSRKAKNGDKKAQTELYNINRELSKQANKQLKELRAKGYTSFGYKAAVERNKILTGYSRFKYGRETQNDIDFLTENAISANRFLEYDTATIAGYEKMMDRHIEAVEKFTHSKIADRDLYIDFMRTEAFSELMKIDSGQTLEMTVDSIKSEKDLQKLKRLYKKYEKNKIKYDELVEEFSGVNPFD